MRRILTLIVTFCFIILSFPSAIRANEVTPTVPPTPSPVVRLAGSDRYLTAIQISQAGWTDGSSSNVVLARGDDFPDALTGAVLAKKLNAPLLLTDKNQLLPDVQREILRLGAKNAYLLGSDGALSEKNVADVLRGLPTPLTVTRYQGSDRYSTSYEIAMATKAPEGKAFLVNGNNFADAMSISSYAAAHNIPILMTDLNNMSTFTRQAINNLNIKDLTIVGSTGVVSQGIEDNLKASGYTVTRIEGKDRYLTNIKAIQTLDFDRSGIFIATGTNFPDALAAAVLAAQPQKCQPIVFINDQNVPADTSTYLNTLRPAISKYTFLGSYGLIPYGTESMIRTGSLKPLISLQYWQGYSSTGYLNQLALIPGKANDTVDFVSPNWYTLNNIQSGQVVANGTFTGLWAEGSANYTQLVNSAHTRGLKVLPLIASEWNSNGMAAIDSLLTHTTERENLVTNLVQMVKNTGVDGVVIDFEYLSDSSGPFLTQFMQSLYTKLHAQNKMVVMAVMSRTSSTEYKEFNYHDLSQYVDYLNIMTYDYSLSTPGPVAPIAWVKKVLDYTQTQIPNMSKVLMGIPYYGRDWTKTDSGYSLNSIDLYTGLRNANIYKATIQRETSPGDSIGIPKYTYTDVSNAQHTVYFDDPASWDTKLSLLSSYNLGGIGSWSLYWVNNDTPDKLFPLLQRHLR